MNKIFVAFLFLILSLVAYVGLQRVATKNTGPLFARPTPTVSIASPSATPILTPTPTPKPLTLNQTSQLYGPCVRLPVLMYHHIQSAVSAKNDHQASLTVDTPIFQKQLEYLKDHKFTAVSPKDLANYFDRGISLPAHSVMLTFDDAYADFATDAAPLLEHFGFKATVFVPTGLVDNPDYLNWSTIRVLASTGLITFANHTWSHHSTAGTPEIVKKEISTAQTQLADHDVATPYFAYPYGTVGKTAPAYLFTNGYLLAFTTQHGSLECKKQRLTLPRLRIGNAPLSSYGV